MGPWEELPPDRQRANLAQAKDIGVKLEAIDSIVVPRSAGAPEFAFTAEEIEQLAQMEHRRWVQDRQAEGYVHGLDRESGQHPTWWIGNISARAPGRRIVTRSVSSRRYCGRRDSRFSACHHARRKRTEEGLRTRTRAGSASLVSAALEIWSVSALEK